MTRRQRLIKALIEHKWQHIKSNFGAIDSVKMEREERTMIELKNKLPEDARKDICRA